MEYVAPVCTTAAMHCTALYGSVTSQPSLPRLVALKVAASADRGNDAVALYAATRTVSA
jgi:hypothetical protein